MKLIRKFVAVGAMCLAFAGVAGQIAQGQQRTTSLFSTGCVRRGSVGNLQDNISIGREAFTRIFYIDNGGQITCRIRPAGSPPRFKTLRLAFGITDSRASELTVDVNIYLDGNLAASRTLSVGEKSLLILDVSRVSSVAIEVPQGSNDIFTTIRVSFVQALLEPISSSPGRRQ